MASKKNTGLLVAGAAVLAFFLFGSKKASAAEPVPDIKPEPKPTPDPDQPKPPIDKPKPIQQPQPEPADDFGGNWGATPPGLIPEFLKAEQASGIKGLGRFMAVKAWQAARANQPILSPIEAQIWALAHPNLCQDCSNPGDANASFRGLEQVTLPKGEVGPYGGVGSYAKGKTWPKPADYNSWGEIGAAGLFDMLGSTAVYSGIHDKGGKFLPLLPYPASILFQVDVQLYVAGVYAARCLNRPDIPLFSRAKGDPTKLWTGLASCWLSPAGFIANNQASKDAAARFAERAKEIGIDLASLDYPGFVKDVYPGDKGYYTALGVQP